MVCGNLCVHVKDGKLCVKPFVPVKNGNRRRKSIYVKPFAPVKDGKKDKGFI